MREAIKRENISMDEVHIYHWKIDVFQDWQNCFQVDKRVLGTSEEKQAMPEEAEKVNQEEQS